MPNYNFLACFKAEIQSLCQKIETFHIHFIKLVGAFFCLDKNRCLPPPPCPQAVPML